MIQRSPRCPLFIHPPVKSCRTKARLALIKNGHAPQPHWIALEGNSMDAWAYRLDCVNCDDYVIVYAEIPDYDGPAVRRECKGGKQ